MNRVPPYTITPEIRSLVVQIGEAIGQVEASGIMQDARLQKQNRVRAIHGSLAIEGNILSEDQVSTILDGKRVVAPLKDIQEVRNAIQAYEQYPQWNPASEADLLKAHAILTAGLLDAPGSYRRVGVAVVGGGEVHHHGPPHARVPALMADLLEWLAGTDEHPLIAGSVFHYEFEFIHPFEDGNGRMGRLWQTLVLTRWRPLFAWIPVESMVYAHQSEYYSAIRESSAAGESTPFILFMLQMVLEAMQTPQVTPQVPPQVERLLAVVNGEMSRQEIQEALGLKDRKSLRENYLLPALEHGYLEMTRPESPNAKNQKYRLTQRGRRAKRGGG